MASNLKKVSSLTNISPSIITPDDLLYHINKAPGVYNSYSVTLSDFFIGTNNIDNFRFSSNTIVISPDSLKVTGTLDIVGSEDISGTLDISGVISSSVATGTAPLVLISNTVVTNLNADYLDGQHGSYYTSFPAGTRMPFAQASAPTGWTQDTSDAANNRMLRVVSSVGGGTGGSHSPVLNNVVASHTHTFSTGNDNTDHAHSGSSGGMSADHYHSGNTGSENTAHSHSGYTAVENTPHSHTVYDSGHTHQYYHPTHTEPQSGSATQCWVGDGLYTTSGTTTGIYLGNNSTTHNHGFSTGSESAAHGHSFSTGYVSSDHSHSLSIGGRSAYHQHAGSTDNGSSQTNWTPKYIDMIICTKN